MGLEYEPMRPKGSRHGHWRLLESAAATVGSSKKVKSSDAKWSNHCRVVVVGEGLAGCHHAEWETGIDRYQS